MIQNSTKMDKLKIGDILLMDGKAYVSMDMYKRLLDNLSVANMLTDSYAQRLSVIEEANENRRSMKIIKMK